MWPKLTKKGDDHRRIEPQKSLDVNDEYLSAVRTKSYAEFQVKFQLLVVNEPSSLGFSETLLDPGQETTASILRSSSSHAPKPLLSDYFHVSAEASAFCSRLLKTLARLQSDYRLVEEEADSGEPRLSGEILRDPFSEIGSFERIHDEHSSVLRRLKSSRRRAARKVRAIRAFNRASGVCGAAAAGALAAAAVVLAAHTLTALLVGPAILALPMKPVGSRVRRLGREGLIKSESLGKTIEQLDVAAKGAYILNRDFDTMGRLVGRLGDEVEHNRSMIRMCLERKEEKMSLEVLREIKKCEFGFKKRVDELEEHVCLCLVTINRARAMLVTQISKEGS